MSLHSMPVARLQTCERAYITEEQAMRHIKHQCLLTMQSENRMHFMMIPLPQFFLFPFLVSVISIFFTLDN